MRHACAAARDRAGVLQRPGVPHVLELGHLDVPDRRGGGPLDARAPAPSAAGTLSPATPLIAEAAPAAPASAALPASELDVVAPAAREAAEAARAPAAEVARAALGGAAAALFPAKQVCLAVPGLRAPLRPIWLVARASKRAACSPLLVVMKWGDAQVVTQCRFYDCVCAAPLQCQVPFSVCQLLACHAQEPGTWLLVESPGSD